MNTQKMAALVMVVLGAANALAVGFLGSPNAEIGAGRWSFDYSYSYSSQDTDKQTANYDMVGIGSGTFKMKLKDFNLQRHYATIGYGLDENWDIYVSLGVADLKTQGKDYGDPNGFEWGMNYDNTFAWGWGTRYTFARQDNIAWGAAFQMNWLDTDLKKNYAGGDSNKYSIETYDILVSAGPTVDFGGWKVYGGPFYYYLNGDYENKYTNTSGALAYIEKSDIRADQNWGAFIGSIFDLGQNCKWTVEYSTTGKAWGVASGIGLTF